MKRKYIRSGLLVCGILIVTTISLYIVNMPALFDCMVLSNNSSANIGSAIGGISALIVGIANVVMLYLTFGSQMKTLQLQEKKMAQHAEEQKKTEKHQNEMLNVEKERNEEFFMSIRLDKIADTWTTLISEDINDKSKEVFDNVLVFNMKIFLSTLEVLDNKLFLSKMHCIFDTHIRHFYSVRRYDKNPQFMKEYTAIEEMFNKKRV